MFVIPKEKFLDYFRRPKTMYTFRTDLRAVIDKYQSLVFENEDYFIHHLAPSSNIENIADVNFSRNEVAITYIKTNGLLLDDVIYMDTFLVFANRLLEEE